MPVLGVRENGNKLFDTSKYDFWRIESQLGQEDSFTKAKKVASYKKRTERTLALVVVDGNCRQPPIV